MDLLFDALKKPLTEDQIDKIVEDSAGMSDQFCRLFTYWCMGLMRSATSLGFARQSIFQLINQELEKGKKHP
jgi:hypothetical protein